MRNCEKEKVEMRLLGDCLFEMNVEAIPDSWKGSRACTRET